jgi:hypothetical protein
LDERVTANLDRPFAVTGRRAYLIGHMNGRFPDLGHHLPGEMGGLWAPPIKLADGFWFGLRAQTGGDNQGAIIWLGPANSRSFTMKPGQAEREFAVELGGRSLVVRQELIVPEHEPGLLIGITVENPSAQPIDLMLCWLTRFDVQGAWWSNWPDCPDEAQIDWNQGAVIAYDSHSIGWAAAMLADQPPIGVEAGADIWGEEQTRSLNGKWGATHGGILSNPAELQGGGISGKLSYRLTVAGSQRSALRCVLAGSTRGTQQALSLASDLLRHYDGLAEEKRTGTEAVLAGAPIVCSPRPDLDRVFAWQNPCLDMLTFDLPGVGHGIVGGLPGFAWYFGCDTYYSVGGLLVSGQAQTALDGLSVLGEIGRAHNGRIPHEITQTGRLFNLGNAVEAGQFVIAVERAFRWTGDADFLARMYPICRAAIFDYLLGECDQRGDLLPDGPGMLELRTAHHGKKLDVACALYQGLRSLAYLAHASGDLATAQRCRQTAPEVREQINRYFWSPARQEYLWRIEPDLTQHPAEPAHSYAVLEMGVLGTGEEERITALFERVEGPEHTGPAGIIHPGTRDFVMPIQNAIVAQAEFRYGRVDQGLWYLERMAELAGYYMPWAIPEFVGHDACFLQAWSSAAYNWLLVQGVLRLEPDPVAGTVRVQPELPSDWDFFAVKNLPIAGARYDLHITRGPAGLRFAAEERVAGRRRLSFAVDQAAVWPSDFA